MSQRWPTSCGAHRRGLSLVEVTAGLVVLGTVLAAVAVARGRALRQWGEAERRLRAVQALDSALEQWSAGAGLGANLPVPGEGELSPAEGLTWRSRRINEDGAARLGVEAVRVEVFDRGGAPVLAVELLVDPPPQGGGAPP
jgi:Tfp pilus assembly protein PilV